MEESIERVNIENYPREACVYSTKTCNDMTKLVLVLYVASLTVARNKTINIVSSFVCMADELKRTRQFSKH